MAAAENKQVNKHLVRGTPYPKGWGPNVFQIQGSLNLGNICVCVMSCLREKTSTRLDVKFITFHAHLVHMV